MASLDGGMTIHIRMVPDEDTMKAILALLNLWQDSHPDQMVAMVPARDRYQYEIIERGKIDGNG